MEARSPSADRIGAALRALRRTHADEPGDMAALGLKCLQAVVAELAADGVAPEDLQPLTDLQGRLARRESDSAASAPGPSAEPSAAPTGTKRDRRHGTPPSPTLLARAAVIIDLLVRAGQDEAEAAQTVMRRLMAAGVPAPARGGDSRGWRRLLEYRHTLLHGGGTDDAKFEYRAFAREIEAIPPAERVSRVLDERLWDRRRAPRRT
ncbi:hypothetical protein AUC71_09815 [Methyloceanibacter marginalis]|uniref:Uncharacterized protein n=1 Tax=Methyloceanibacter marginalis TaxID=1774971 RepID=A0A1E3WC58_9HYPH|nr:hypothetical protein [Methyloceanibacter marginalis]ODS03398.1 hypothetical protein AUC71_09815 [Methyloceanibacter marginalis]